MSILSLYVVNKSGGLVFSKDFSDKVSRVDLNDSLRLASICNYTACGACHSASHRAGQTPHSLHAIAAQLSPLPGCNGIELLESETFDLHCLETPTGTKFLLVVDPSSPYIPSVLQRVYELYSDYVLKNPFYEVEQVIKCELFDEHLETLARRYPAV